MSDGSYNFFDAQTRSRRWSFLFGLGFLLSLAMLFFLVKFVFGLPLDRLSGPGPGLQHRRRADMDHPPAMAVLMRKAATGDGLGLLAVGLVAVAAVVRVAAIKKGGSTYLASVIRAAPLGDGGLFPGEAGKRREKLLADVVAEMALAASIPEPEIFILDREERINAMAAGMGRDDYAVILTKGALKYLDRDELAALLAHEYSHLLNGDTVHYSVMSGYLRGLYVLESLGRGVVRKSRRPGHLVLGLAVIVLGAFSSLVGRVLQAAFSRSREKLADASAAQYTRNPKALAGVLKKIGGQETPRGRFLRGFPEYNHFFMAEPDEKTRTASDASWWKSIFSAHPPVAERVWDLEPDWDGWYWDFDKNPVDFLSERAPGDASSPAPGSVPAP
ncbi:MAG: M48 family metalloprotease, partial [Deltaproteobacteria bacterium]|nr:M48 family metalloprotease [Deltaproteobacteria bacterium]